MDPAAGSVSLFGDEAKLGAFIEASDRGSGLGDVLDLESMKRTRSLLFDTEAEALTFADRHKRTVADAGHFLGVAATEGGRWGVFLLRENVEGKLEAYMPDADVIRQDRDGSLSGSDGAPQDLPGIA